MVKWTRELANGQTDSGTLDMTWDEWWQDMYTNLGRNHGRVVARGVGDHQFVVLKFDDDGSRVAVQAVRPRVC